MADLHARADAYSPRLPKELRTPFTVAEWIVAYRLPDPNPFPMFTLRKRP